MPLSTIDAGSGSLNTFHWTTVGVACAGGGGGEADICRHLLSSKVPGKHEGNGGEV